MKKKKDLYGIRDEIFHCLNLAQKRKRKQGLILLILFFSLLAVFSYIVFIALEENISSSSVFLFTVAYFALYLFLKMMIGKEVRGLVVLIEIIEELDGGEVSTNEAKKKIKYLNINSPLRYELFSFITEMENLSLDPRDL